MFIKKIDIYFKERFEVVIFINVTLYAVIPIIFILFF